jgi:hypothetical protein
MSKINSIKDMPAQKLLEIESTIHYRYFENKSKFMLRNNNNTNYNVQVSQSTLITPDGVRMKIEKKLKDGSLLIRVPADRIFKTQDYLNIDTVIRHAKNKSLGKKGFRGDLTPDGRFFILDGHHRTTAYSMKNDNKVLMRIFPNKEGKYYSLTHFDLINFYGLWSNVEFKLKNKIYRDAQAGEYGGIKNLYNKLFKVIK